MSFKFCVKLYVRRGLRALRLGHCGKVETRVSTLASWYCSDATVVRLRHGFRPLCLGAVVVAMISPASGVWTLIFDDLSLVIFRQPTVMHSFGWLEIKFGLLRLVINSRFA